MSQQQLIRTDGDVIAGANIVGPYRYALWRIWEERDPASPSYWPMTFIMLNPSTGDATLDDATIRRCRSFARRDGAPGILIVNLFAYRTAYPTELVAAGADGVDIEGPSNRRFVGSYLRGAAMYDARVVAAWGAHPVAVPAADHLRQMIDADPAMPKRLWCLGTTKSGAPRHPGRLGGDTPFTEWE